MINLPMATEPTPVIGPMPSNPGEQFKHIEIEINVACDLACFACDRMSDVTTAPNMTVTQVKRFIEESIDLNWKWERIRLLGGEPTIHPQFKEMVELLIEYRRHHDSAFLQVLTNGRGKSALYRSYCEKNGISLHAESKTPGVTPQWFTNTRIAPVDLWPGIGEVTPCGIFGIRGCGIGLTRHGYFLDGAGATVARVAGLDVGVMNLKDVTWESMLEQSKVLCRLCGHWGPRGERPAPVTKTGEITGQFWSSKIAEYRVKKPTLKVYGEVT